MRVLVGGYYGFGNTGDEAIALSVARELRSRGHTAVLLSKNPEQTAALYSCEAAPRMHPQTLLELARCDVFLSGGGGLLQDKTSGRTLLYYLGLIAAAKALGKRVWVFNQSIGPLSVRGREQVAAVLAGGAVRCVVRDRASQSLLKELGIEAELGGDPALLLSTETAERKENRVVIAPRGDVTEALPALRELTATLQSEGKEVVALSFYPHEDDEAAQSLEANRVVSTTSPAEALAVVAGAGAVVGVRLHAVILAAAASVPFVGVAYDPKVSGFCSDARAPFFPTSVEAAHLREALRQPLDEIAVADMKTRASRSFDLIG